MDELAELREQVKAEREARLKLERELEEEREARRALEAKVRELQFKVEIDADTGLLNKHAFMDRIEREKGRMEFMRRLEDEWFGKHPHSRRPRLSPVEQSLAVVMIDADRLKYVNDTFGHKKGDELLKAIADAMRRAIRPDDEAARLGGDEFALLLRKADVRIARKVCRRLLTILAHERLAVPDAEIEIHSSVGAAVYQIGTSTSIEDVIRAADLEMYTYKQRRRSGLPSPVTVRKFLP
ncbi:GGDEF domain-containing protein [Candidatus Uhrbacteria bacterium]|nr:GGDEF domain-containing protein [Candidatus Uhrbacteria bacterium]